jgi:hypothetical protein
VRAQVSKDEARFKDRADRVFDLASREQLGGFLDCGKDIDAAYEETLKPWIEAEKTLTREVLLSGKPNDLARLNEQVALGNKIIGLRRMYAGMEVVAPILFALLAILFAQFRSTLGQTGLPIID